jgi:hypothetical protein
MRQFYENIDGWEQITAFRQACLQYLSLTTADLSTYSYRKMPALSARYALNLVIEEKHVKSAIARPNAHRIEWTRLCSCATTGQPARIQNLNSDVKCIALSMPQR